MKLVTLKFSNLTGKSHEVSLTSAIMQCKQFNREYCGNLSNVEILSKLLLGKIHTNLGWLTAEIKPLNKNEESSK